MAKKYKVKITIIKMLGIKDLYSSNPPATPTVEDVCPKFKVGQSFIVGEEGDIPKGFCTWAWNDLFTAYTHLRLGGDFPWIKEQGSHIACCTDGFRPVIFKLERMTEKQKE